MQLNKNNNAEAEILFRKAIETDGSNLMFKSQLALSLINQGKSNEAEAEIEKILKVDPNFVAALWYGGINSFQNLSNFRKSVTYFEKAYPLISKQSPHNPQREPSRVTLPESCQYHARKTNLTMSKIDLKCAFKLYKWISIICLAVYIPYIIYDDFNLFKKIETIYEAGISILFHILFLLVYFLGFSIYYWIIALLIIKFKNPILSVVKKK